MESRRPIAIGTTVLGLLAIGATAGIYAHRSASRVGGVSTSAGAVGANDQVGLPAWLVEHGLTILLGAGLLFAVATAVAIWWFRGREGLRRMARFVADVALGGAVVLLMYVGTRWLWVLFDSGGTTETAAGSPGAVTPGGGAAAGATGGDLPSRTVIAAVFALLAVAMYFVLQRKVDPGGTTAMAADRPEPPASDGGDRDEPAIVIDDVPQSNAVYRAWREMATRALDSSDRTATASEVARAARRADFDREAVSTLTDLFEEVRYGDRPVTAEREQAAEAALEALEGAPEVDA